MEKIRVHCYGIGVHQAVQDGTHSENSVRILLETEFKLLLMEMLLIVRLSKDYTLGRRNSFRRLRYSFIVENRIFAESKSV